MTENELIEKLNKYANVDQLIIDLISFLKIKSNKIFLINEIDEFLISLNAYISMIKNLDQISKKKKGQILNILNEIMIIYNEKLMNEICKQI